MDSDLGEGAAVEALPVCRRDEGRCREFMGNATMVARIDRWPTTFSRTPAPSFSYTKTPEDSPEQIVRSEFPRDLAEFALRKTQLLGDEFAASLREQGAGGFEGGTGAGDRFQMAGACGDGPGVGG